jgi:hypothetical protein
VLISLSKKNPQFILCKLQRARESVREIEKTQKAKTKRSKPLLAAAVLPAANRQGHHHQTPRPVRLLLLPAAAALSSSPHSVTTPDAPHRFRFQLSLKSQIWTSGIFFFFSFPVFLLFCSYLVSTACLLYCLVCLVLFLSTDLLLSLIVGLLAC